VKQSFKETIYELKYFLVGTLLLISFFVLLVNYTRTTCAKITEESNINSCRSIVYKFKAGQKSITGNIDIGILKKEISFTEMQKMKCIEINYSRLIPNLNWITDKRIIK